MQIPNLLSGEIGWMTVAYEAVIVAVKALAANTAVPHAHAPEARIGVIGAARNSPIKRMYPGFAHKIHASRATCTGRRRNELSFLAVLALRSCQSLDQLIE